MGVSFKVSKTGTRYRPKLSLLLESLASEKDDPPDDTPVAPLPEEPRPVDNELVAAYSTRKPELFENEVSFSLNLFPEGFSIGEPDQGGRSPFLQIVPKLLHPYNKASQSLFSSIENGWLPGDVFDDLPCKYLNGTILCEVRDFRNCTPPLGNNISSGSSYPIVERVQLQMCTENVVKDLHLISEDTWTYRDLLEVESRIVKALQPVLCLDPIPSMDRLFKGPVLQKLNFGIHVQHTRKGSSVSSVKPTANQTFQGKDVYGVVENSKPQEKLAVSYAHPSLEDKLTGRQNVQINTPKKMPPNCQAPPTSCIQSFCLNAGTTSNFVLGTLQNFGDQRNSRPASLGKRVRSKAQISHRPKKQKQEFVNSVKQCLSGNQVDMFASKDFPCKSNLQSQFGTYEGQSVGPQAILAEKERTDLRMHWVKHNQCPSPVQWSYTGQFIKEGLSGYEVSSDTTSSQNLQGSDVPTDSPASSLKCGGHSSYLSEVPNATCSLPAEVGPDKEKSTNAASVNSGNYMYECGKQRANSMPSAPSKSTCGSPVSVGNISTQLGANSPMVGTTEVQTYPESEDNLLVLGNFMKIKTLTERYNLKNRDKKVDICYDGKWSKCSPQLLVVELSQLENTEGFRDDRMPMSKCFIGGKTDACKTRKLTFLPRVLRGNVMPIFVHGRPTQLLMSETPKDRLVEAQIIVGDEFCDPGLLPTFPNTHHADLFAAQFSSLMLKEGYGLIEDQLQPMQPAAGQFSFNTSPLSHTGTTKLPFLAAIPGQPLDPRNLISSAAPKPTPQLPSSVDRLAKTVMHSHGNLKALPLPSADLASLQIEPIHHLEKSWPVVNKALGRSTFHGDMANHPLQRYWLQQQPRQQLQQQLFQRMLAGRMEPASGMGAVGNRSLEFGNVSGTGRAYCGPVGMTHISQSQSINSLAHVSNFGVLNQQVISRIRSQTASVANIQLGHGRGRGMVSGGSTWGPIESVARMAGMGSMRGGGKNLQFSAIEGISSPGALKFSSGSYGMNQQQLQVSSPLLQQVGLPMQQVGSPMRQPGNGLHDHVVRSPLQQYSEGENILGDRLGSPISHVSPQQMSQEGPMGSLQANAGSVGVGADSPQLSSQTRGSVGGSIDNSLMELQGVLAGGSTSSGGHGVE